jgi:hypothetical protein
MTLAVLFLCRFTAGAQDLLSDLPSDGKKEKEFAMAAFKSTRLINFHTLETVGPKTLDFRISHRFGTLSQGAYDAWGIDGPATIRLGLDYSYDGRLMFGIGRSNLEKMVDGYLKYRLVRQGLEGGSPVAVTLCASMFRNGEKGIQVGAFNKYEYPSDRLSYVNQVIVGRKFSPSVSMQIAPFLVHYNLVDKSADKNDMYGVAGAARFKFTKRSAVTVEYAYRMVTDYSVDNTYYNSFGIGYELETGGHVFQVHLTNSDGMADNQFFARTRDSWSNNGIRLGFNISRVFSIPAAGETKGKSW